MASDSNSPTIASSAIRPVMSSTRPKVDHGVQHQPRRGLRPGRWGTITTRPDSTIAVSQATTAVQIAASASDPASGTGSESVRTLLRTTSGTTRWPSFFPKPTSNGMVKLVTSPASMSGSRLRIAAKLGGQHRCARAAATDPPSVSPAGPGVASTNRSNAPAKPSTMDSWSGHQCLCHRRFPTITVPLWDEMVKLIRLITGHRGPAEQSPPPAARGCTGMGGPGLRGQPRVRVVNRSTGLPRRDRSSTRRCALQREATAASWPS